MLRPGGSLIAEAGVVPDAVRSRSLPAQPQTISLRHRNVPMRVLEWPARDGCGGVVGVDVRPQLMTLAKARIGITISALMLSLSLGGVAWLVAKRATAELDRLADEVATIEAGGLDRRLVPRRTLEVDRLASVLNRVIARLRRR